MIKVTVKKVKLSEIKLNPDNPRTISKEDMARLVKSLQDFPEMMELREIIVDETLTVLGGNMRTLALRKAGALEATAKVVEGLTAEQKREFVVKDNGAWGVWDFDLLANSWGDLPLDDWGIPGLVGLVGGNEEKLDQKEEKLDAYNKTHILISVDILALGDVIELVNKLKKIEGVEIEQSSN